MVKKNVPKPVNPTYRAQFLNDTSADEYVSHAFASRPDIIETYLNLTVPIFKADLLRYLLLFDHGGIYSDLDVSCLGPPIDQWIPEEFKDKANLVVGWEFDMGWKDLEPFARQFTTWTIMAKPKLNHMLQVINNILEGLHKKAEDYKCRSRS